MKIVKKEGTGGVLHPQDLKCGDVFSITDRAHSNDVFLKIDYPGMVSLNTGHTYLGTSDEYLQSVVDKVWTKAELILG